MAKAGIEMGFPHVTMGGAYPYNAADWANPKLVLHKWRVLGQGEAPAGGDVQAQQADYSDATGHVVIVGESGNWIGTGTWLARPSA